MKKPHMNKADLRRINDTVAAAMGSGYQIEDPRPIRRENPFSFYVPCQERLDALAAGDRIKVIFTPEINRRIPAPNQGSERLWLVIESVDGDDIRAVVESTPMFPKMLGLAQGDAVSVKRHHVVGIETVRADDPIETNDNEQWFRRCSVDVRILHSDLPIDRIVRNEPLNEAENNVGVERFGWSGWRFEAAGYEPGMRLDIFALVVPMRRQLGYEHLLDAPEGTVIERSGDTYAIVA